MATRAVIDIGTNATKLLVGKVNRGVITPIYRARDVTRLSENFFESRRLRPEAIGRTAEAVSRFVSHALRYNPESIRIVATSAARDALNRAELISAIERGTGIKTEIISGEQEAQWAYDGVLSDHAVAREAAVVFDLGSGSTELILGEDGIVRARHSYPLGATRLLQSLKPAEPPLAANLAACRSAARSSFAKASCRSLGLPWRLCFALNFSGSAAAARSPRSRVSCVGESSTPAFQLSNSPLFGP